LLRIAAVFGLVEVGPRGVRNRVSSTISVRMGKFSQKPGFLDFWSLSVGSQKPGFLQNLGEDG